MFLGLVSFFPAMTAMELVNWSMRLAFQSSPGLCLHMAGRSRGFSALACMAEAYTAVMAIRRQDIHVMDIHFMAIQGIDWHAGLGYGCLSLAMFYETRGLVSRWIYRNDEKQQSKLSKGGNHTAHIFGILWGALLGLFARPTWPHECKDFVFGRLFVCFFFRFCGLLHQQFD